MGSKRGDCVHWPAIERTLADGPQRLGVLAAAMYGADDPDNRAAAALVMMRMARQERVVRLRPGVFTLPDKVGHRPVFNRETLAAYIIERGRTAREIALHFDITPQHAWRSVLRLGVNIEVRRAHPDRWWRRNAPCSTFKIRRLPDREFALPPRKYKSTKPVRHKRCAACGQAKPRTPEHYYFDKRGLVTGYCRPCQKAWNAAYHREARRPSRAA